MKTAVNVIIASFLLLSACDKPLVESTPESALEPLPIEGKWEEPSEDRTLADEQITLTLQCDDTFKLKMYYWTDALAYKDTCRKPSDGEWTEYAFGEYEVENDTLSLSGWFATADFEKKEEGCYRIGEFNREFRFKTDSGNIHLEILNYAEIKDEEEILGEKIEQEKVLNNLKRFNCESNE